MQIPLGVEKRVRLPAFFPTKFDEMQERVIDLFAPTSGFISRYTAYRKGGCGLRAFPFCPTSENAVSG